MELALRLTVLSVWLSTSYSRDVDTDKPAPLLQVGLDKFQNEFWFVGVFKWLIETVDISDVSVDTNNRPI